jgi:hypothetical protein
MTTSTIPEPAAFADQVFATVTQLADAGVYVDVRLTSSGVTVVEDRRGALTPEATRTQSEVRALRAFLSFTPNVQWEPAERAMWGNR